MTARKPKRKQPAAEPEPASPVCYAAEAPTGYMWAEQPVKRPAKRKRKPRVSSRASSRSAPSA